jgi:eukaryotic-like serine/threonine-protein kinase
MNPELEKLFDQAASLAGTEREEFISRHCPDPLLRRELEMLLAFDQGAETFLQSTVLNAASSMLQALTFSPGQRLGRYRVLSVIGRGGMGLVYLAERADGKFEQQVALKVLQNGSGQPLVAEQLQRECRILASLEHPNIARVLDADVTETGLPYFVMEYVDGQPIDRYCDDHKLSVRDRLRVFLPVCDAVHVAHQKLIVHRDLKPDNILVTRQGIPKLLDFGIAKVLSEVPVSPQNTETRIMTPEYASPEQARGEPVTTGTDVYLLGGVLYKLLTGKTPQQLADRSPLAMARAICEEEVRKPSELRRELAGDVEHILLMALRKEPQHRYRSVDQFGSDIRNLLDQKPIIARADTLWYRSSKYFRRHLVAVSTTAAIVAVLGIFAVLQTIQLRQTRRERDRANRITGFMSSMFKVSDPSEARGNSVTAREILDKASSQIESGLAKDPETQAQMMHVMGGVYLNLGLYPRGESLMSRAVDIRRRLLGPEHPDTLQSMSELGKILGVESRWSEEEKLDREVLEIRRRLLGPQNPATSEAMLNLARCLNAEGRYPEAAKLQREALESLRRVFGPADPETLNAMRVLSRILADAGEYPEAERLNRELLDLRRRLQGPDHPDTVMTLSNLGWVLCREGRFTEAESFLREAVVSGRRVLGPEHPIEIGMTTRLAIDLYGEGRDEEAEKLQRETLDLRLRVEGPASYGVIATEQNLALTLVDEGRYAEAEVLLKKAVKTGRQALGAEYPVVLTSDSILGWTMGKEGHEVEAEKVGHEALDSLRRVNGPEHPDTLAAQAYLASTLIRQGRYAEAEELARKNLDVERRVLGPGHVDTLANLEYLGLALTYQHRYDEARRLFNETVSKLSSDPGGNRSQAWYYYACVDAVANNREAAIQHLHQAFQHGYQNLAHMRSDDDLRSLRGDPRFEALLAGSR